ncbi:Mov34-domain-containing protein [Testicularia cyperi]|uniref:COP9 signalosome complex subunit 6 n=1 Tax=Testicularia cyperi TaxID=1882483 RepID=A0A317XVG6_9BASI|nr:Mov34-domain-containing protein [Testicularia cyperi]
METLAEAGPSGPSSTSVVLDTHPSSGVGSHISLHPLPILNISEHLVRTRLQTNNAETKVYGVLLGTQQGRDIEIQNTFEIKVDSNSDTDLNCPVVDHTFLKSRQSQYRQVFPTLDLLGWYTTGSAPASDDLEVHKQLASYNETPLLVQLSQNVTSFQEADRNGELPIKVYESVVELIHGEATSFFVPATYRIDTGEAERIAIDHASKAGAGSGADAESTVLTGIQTQHSAISKLGDRISQVLKYLESVRSGAATWDYEAMRQIQTVSANLPVTVLPELKNELLKEHNDVLLTSYLSILTESLHTMNELTDKFEVVQAAAAAEESQRSGMPGDASWGMNSGKGSSSASGKGASSRSSALRAVYS